MAPDDTLARTPHLIPVDHATLHPCPQCGARPWFQGLTSSPCAPCGYRDGPTPQEILEQQAQTGWPEASPYERRCSRRTARCAAASASAETRRGGCHDRPGASDRPWRPAG